jgi:CubicO group peptidase (beta-lactamase class C family)
MNTAALESFIFDKMSATRLPGLSVALVKDGRVAYARGFGHADIARGKPATERTLYGAASLTKSFLAVAVLQLVEKGLLKLTDPAEKFGPCPIKSTAGDVTIEHLLTHTSGTPALGYIEAVLRHAHGIGGCHLPIADARDVLTFAQGAAATGWPEAPAGDRWFYLNEGYVLLGEIVHKLTGQPYEQYLREHVLAPLGMSRSFFAEDDVRRDGDVATPYVLPKPAAPPREGRYLYNVFGGDASLITSVLDLAKYAAALLDGGRGILSPDAYARLVRPRVALPAEPLPHLWGGAAGSAKPSQYALGLTVTDDFLGEPLIGHTGSLIVATSYLAYMPKSNAAVALLCNGNGYSMAQLGKVALAVLLGRDPEELTFVRTEKRLKELTGYYETYRGTLRAKIAQDGDLLRIEYLCGDQSPGAVTLLPELLAGDEPRFFTYSEGARLDAQFRLKENAPTELIFERYKFRRTGPLT